MDYIFIGLLAVAIVFLYRWANKQEKAKKEKEAAQLLEDKAKAKAATLKPKSEEEIREFLSGFDRFQQSHLCLSCGYSGLVGIKVSQKVWGVRIGAFLLPILFLLQLGLGNILILFGGIPTATVLVILYGVLLVVGIKQPRVCPNCETHHGVIS